jgi:hypothetical protein
MRHSTLFVGFALLGALVASGATILSCGVRSDGIDIPAQGGGASSSSDASGGAGMTGSSSSSTGTGGAGGNGGPGASNSGAGGAGGGKPASCVPSELASGAVTSACGVFVSSSKGDDTDNDGSQGKPFKTLQNAVTKANGKPVYACAEAFTEAVTISSAVTLYGALDCTKGWVYDASKKTALTASADAVPLTMLQAAKNVEVFDVAITSATAVTAGTSSIAVLANGAGATFTRCDLTAGDGADGAPGVSASSTPPAQPAKSQDGGNACTAEPVGGGQQNTKLCGGATSIGGKGGDGNDTNGGDGQSGQIGTSGKGGTGEPIAATWSCVTGTGQPGDNGVVGVFGSGATGTGSLTASGYTGASGMPGAPGTPGQGGGGGGGAKGGLICPNPTPPGPTVTGAGASGGAGGVGGCGGDPGQGGGPAGGSIALASVGATISLVDCTLTAGKGGTGGAGGDAQSGGLGGLAGLGGNPSGQAGSKGACAGGSGGQGGDGGPGGGGLGGPSIAIAFTGTAPVQMSVAITAGNAGVGGIGGDGDMTTAGIVGGAGQACKTLGFDTMNCEP